MQRRTSLAGLALGLSVVLLPAGPVGAEEPVWHRLSPRTVAGDTYSFHHQLGALIDEVFQCFSVHGAGHTDNTVTFNGVLEPLDPYLTGTQPFIFEFETASRNPRGPEPDLSIEINTMSSPGTDLFPEGFEDPESGTPLEAACIEIGIDDTLDSDEPAEVVSAALEFENDTGPLFPHPIDITSAFSDPWNGRLSIVFPGLAGRNINSVRLMIETTPSNADIFSDGFETGDASSWTDQNP